LLALSSDRPVPLVLDEFPYLTREAAEFPSVIQRALSPGRRQRAASRTRLLLCGSSTLPVTDLEGTTLRKRGSIGEFRCRSEALINPLFGTRLKHLR
jgi:hypothetical protein